MQRNPDRTTLAAKVAVSAPSGGLAPEASEILALMISTGVAFILYWGGAYGIANLFIPTIIGAIGSWGIWQLIRRSPANVWTPLFAIRASAVVFLGIGGLVTELGSEVTREVVLSLYAYSPEEGAKTNAIFIAGYFITIVSIKVASLLRPLPPRKSKSVVFTERATLRLGVLFLILGFSYTFLIQLPLLLSRANPVLPGTLALMFSALSAVGTFLVALWAVERRGIAYLVVAVLLLIQLLISLILLEKNSVMTALLLVGLAFLLQKVSIYRIVALALALGVLLSFLSPAVTQGRLVHAQIYGDLDGGSVAERLGYSFEYLGGYRLPSLPSDESSSFVRLHYVSPSAFAVTQYDAGLGSDIISNGFSALIPRVLWPDKPNVSDVGSDFYEMISGNNNSALGVVVFADAYWNFGWPGLLLFIPAGAFLWWASWNARQIVEARDWIMMPFVLITFRIAMSIDNFLILSWLTPAVIAVIVLLVLRFAKHGILSTLKSGLTAGAPVHHRQDGLGGRKSWRGRRLRRPSIEG